MSKKDVLIFLNIFIIALKGTVKQKTLKIFSDDVCNMLSESYGISEFFIRFHKFRLACNEPELFRNFDHYLHRVYKVLDKVDNKLYL